MYHTKYCIIYSVMALQTLPIYFGKWVLALKPLYFVVVIVVFRLKTGPTSVIYAARDHKSYVCASVQSRPVGVTL